MSGPPPSESPRVFPLRSALKDESDRTTPGTGPSKAVQISEPVTPAVSEDSSHKRRHSVGLGKRISGRIAHHGNTSRTSLISNNSLDDLAGAMSATQTPDDSGLPSPQIRHGHQKPDRAHGILAKVAEWVSLEKEKKSKRKAKKVSRHRKKSKSPPAGTEPGEARKSGETLRPRADSLDSEASEVSLERLQRIVEDGLASLGLDSNALQLGPKRRPGYPNSQRSSYRLSRVPSSDTDYIDGDAIVPTCEAVLDNSKVASYSEKPASSNMSISSRREEKEAQAWLTFKNEIIRLAHTLRLKGWRRVPLDDGDSISVERLSGALTNAVYVVSPPAELTVPDSGKRRPDKLLLRVYGPQSDQLIDRETELNVLRRLARKKIGPRMLGTFTNGRFEQYFNAETLKAADLRVPETSKQIAKRMRELHDGIELLEDEVQDGPTVWRNWDRWQDGVEEVITYLDKQILSGNPGAVRGPVDHWKHRGLVCGVEWPFFRATVEKYRDFLENKFYKGRKDILTKLVFAHNDTQYGNILRSRPNDDKSPLLQPENEHKQLIVIDFEYAAANVPGLEFANHFTEWTYNYHNPDRPYSCDHTQYPTPEEQHRFIKAYVNHRPQFPHASTPKLDPTIPNTPPLHTATSSSSIVEFMLDARVPAGGWKEEERKSQEQTEKRVQELIEEARIWRAANSAFWVAWGIVQAKVPELRGKEAEQGGDGVEEEGEEADEFDYLGYVQERAYFFWGDCVQLGIVKLEELPEELRGKIKRVDY